MHIFCLDYTVSVSKSYPLRVQNKLTTSARGEEPHTAASGTSPSQGRQKAPLRRGAVSAAD